MAVFRLRVRAGRLWQSLCHRPVVCRFKHKKGDCIIRVWVKNDPDDQSDEAKVLSFISPQLEQLDSLEQHLVHLAAKRVYCAIAETWPLCQNQDSNGHRRFLAG